MITAMRHLIDMPLCVCVRVFGSWWTAGFLRSFWLLIHYLSFSTQQSHDWILLSIKRSQTTSPGRESDNLQLATVLPNKNRTDGLLNTNTFRFFFSFFWFSFVAVNFGEKHPKTLLFTLLYLIILVSRFLSSFAHIMPYNPPQPPTTLGHHSMICSHLIEMVEQVHQLNWCNVM